MGLEQVREENKAWCLPWAGEGRHTVPVWRQTRLDAFAYLLGLVDDKDLGRHFRGMDLMALEMSTRGMEGKVGRGSQAWGHQDGKGLSYLPFPLHPS